jgi:predicted NUDIX family phosphoesterase
MKHELIAVVPAETLSDILTSQKNLYAPSLQLITKIREHVISYPRKEAEEDANFKQIISYYICKHHNYFFLTERKSGCSEQRLKNKLSLGIGGHLTLDDIAKDINSWGEREFEEEVSYVGKKEVSLYTIIYDDRNAVGRVHLGFVYIISLEHPLITIKDELKQGSFVTLPHLHELYESLEPWSQLLLCQILKK